MTWRDAAALAISGLRGSFVRTLLTILGLGVGVGAVVTVMTLGSAGQIRVEDEIARLGVDKVWITSADAAHALTEECALCIASATGVPVCAGTYTAGVVILDGQSAAAQIAGYDAGLADVHKPSAGEGRLFTNLEYSEGSSVCLVDEALAESLGGDVIGKRVSVGNRRFRVIGIVEGMPMQAMTVGSGLLLMPMAAYQDTYGASISEITLAVPRGKSAALLADEALAALSTDGGYRASTLENEIDAAREVVRIFVMVLACVAAVCVLTGAIGVMNVLLVSVRERRREIGLIKAVGGTSAQVAWIFLLEAVAYAALGGVLGIALGSGMIRLFGSWIGLDAHLSLATALPVLAGAALLGAGFGVAPAVRAASMEPVDALRSE
ncbi:MAG: ABC transporter permease [Clostridia bacterium]|nr:ABC transporter permease [Clostridia bacterium]